MVERYRCYGWDIRRGEMRREDDGDWVRHSDYVALKAENERLTRELETATKLKRQYLYAANYWSGRTERALAERAGGVSSLPERAPYEVLQVLGREYETTGDMWAALRDALTTEPAAPEGFCYRDENGQVQYQQMAAEGRQPVAWQWRQRAVYKNSARRGPWSDWIDGRAPYLRVANYEAEERPLYTRPSEQAVTEEWQRVDDALVSCAGLLRTLCRDEIGETAAAELEYVRSVIGRRSEQAVTEAMVARASAEYQVIFGKYLLSSHARRILKAAMEAGRHD